MRMRMLAAAAAIGITASLVLLSPGSSGQAHAATADITPQVHCTETDNFRGAVIEMCFMIDFTYINGDFWPADVRVIYGAPQLLIGDNYHFGIPSFNDCVVYAEIHIEGTDQPIGASRAHWCSAMQSSQSPYESPDGPEEDDPDTMAYRAPMDDPQYREIDIPGSGTYNGALPLILQPGTYCVDLWVGSEFENDSTRNNPACVTLG
jgi:hypothetical protein